MLASAPTHPYIHICTAEDTDDRPSDQQQQVVCSVMCKNHQIMNWWCEIASQTSNSNKQASNAKKLFICSLACFITIIRWNSMEFLTHLHVYHTFDASISMDLRLQCLTSRIYRFPCPVNVTIWRKWIFCKLLGYILTMLYINRATLERFNPYGVNYISVELGIGITIASIQKLLPFPFLFSFYFLSSSLSPSHPRPLVLNWCVSFCLFQRADSILINTPFYHTVSLHSTMIITVLYHVFHVSGKKPNT